MNFKLSLFKTLSLFHYLKPLSVPQSAKNVPDHIQLERYRIGANMVFARDVEGLR